MSRVLPFAERAERPAGELPLFAAAGAPPPLLTFPVHRHAAVEKLARHFVQFDANRAAFFLRSEMERIAERRIAKGIPPDVAITQALDLERAVLCRLVLLQRRGGDAA